MKPGNANAEQKSSLKKKGTELRTPVILHSCALFTQQLSSAELQELNFHLERANEVPLCDKWGRCCNFLLTKWENRAEGYRKESWTLCLPSWP